MMTEIGVTFPAACAVTGTGLTAMAITAARQETELEDVRHLFQNGNMGSGSKGENFPKQEDKAWFYCGSLRPDGVALFDLLLRDPIAAVDLHDR